MTKNQQENFALKIWNSLPPAISSDETLKLFAKYFEVSTDYLLNYYTDNIENEKENELIRIFRTLSSSQQDLYIEQGKAFLRINAKK